MGEIKLRKIVDKDIIHLNKWKNDETVYKFLGGGYEPISLENHAKWLPGLKENNNNVQRRIILDEKSKPIGMIGLYEIKKKHGTCEVGVFIGEHSAHRKGYAAKAYKEIEAFSKKEFKIRKIKLFVVENNIAAVNFWKKLGFENVGKLKNDRLIDNEFYNVLLMEKFI